MRLRLPFDDQLLAHADRERQIGQTAAMQVSEFAPSDPELATAEAVRQHRHVGPARNLALDPRGNAFGHATIITPHRASRPQRLSYGALMKFGTRSGRITNCVDINAIV